MLKGIDQAKNKTFDHEFSIKSCCWTETSSINISLCMNQILFYEDETVDIKFNIETSEKVSNVVTIQCILVQQISVLKDAVKNKKKYELEVSMLSKEPNLPKGVRTDEINFEFDLKRVFKDVGYLLSQKISKQESMLSQISQPNGSYKVNVGRTKSFEKRLK